MRRFTKGFLSMIILTQFANFGSTSVYAQEESSEVPASHPMYDSITALTKIGDGQREVYEISLVLREDVNYDELSADSFDIKNNVNTRVFADTDVFASPYEDDKLELKKDGDSINLTFEAFNFNGAYEPDEDGVTEWSFVSEDYPELNFSLNDVTAMKTETIDDAILGVHTYAGITREYALYLPKNESGTIMNAPLVVWNHGGGEYAGDINTTLAANRGFTAWNENGFETAVLEIQVSNENYTFESADYPEKIELIDRNNALQADLIRNLIEKGYVNSDQVYITGASSGGGATFRFLMQYPELVTASIIIAPMDPIIKIHQGTDDSYEVIVEKLEEAFQGTVNTWSEESNKMIESTIDTQTLLNIPMYFAHAENDAITLSTSSKAMTEALTNLGATNLQLKIYSDEEMEEVGIKAPVLYHWSWLNVLNDAEEDSIMAWLFQQVKE